MKKRIFLGIMLLIWMGLIFYMSNASGDSSGGTSERIITYIVEKIDDIFNASNEVITYHHSEAFINYANLLFRKLCHVGEYFVLFILAFNFIKTFNKYQYKACLIISAVFSLFYACTDEYHQTFVIERSGSINDILIDMIGIILGVFIISLFVKKRQKCKKIFETNCNVGKSFV